MANEKDDGATLSPELVERLRTVRAQLLEQYQTHRTGGMSPEQSLALRSQISYITQIVEPGTQEMWPDYSSAEKQYLEASSLERARGIKHIAMAALGPFAAPALVADQAGATPQSVSNLIEIGFNATAVMGLGRHGARSYAAEAVSLEPVKIAEPHLRLVSSQSLAPMNRPPFVARFTDQPIHKSVPEITEVAIDSQAKNNGHYDVTASVTHIKDFHNWRVAARKSYDKALKAGNEAEPILEWLVDPQIEKLGLALHHYGDGRGQLLADMRGLKEGADNSIDGLIQHYRTSSQGHSEAYKQVSDFEKRLVTDIAGADGELDPTNLRLVVAKLNSGQYMTAHDYAALEYVRDLAHQDFVESKVETYRRMSRYMNLTDEALQKSIQDVRQQAEASSPYVIRQGSHDHEPDPPSDHTPEL